MYRSYENPYRLQDALEQANARYDALKWDAHADPGELFRVHEEIEELKERLNFAWQDNEF